jgi:hypothetical protein
MFWEVLWTLIRGFAFSGAAGSRPEAGDALTASGRLGTVLAVAAGHGGVPNGCFY